MKKSAIILLSATLLFSKSYGQLHVSTSGTKNVLLEVATGTWAGYCPDAVQDIQEKVLPLYPNTIIAAWHNGDSMQVTGDPFCTGSGYVLGFPQATINRAVFTGSVVQDRPWETYVDTEQMSAPKFDVDMISTYDPVTRVMDITVVGTALTSLTGTWYMNGYIIEDSISSGISSIYNQHNYYGTSSPTSCTGSPSWYASAGNPIMPTSLFPHRYVVKHVLCPGGSIWGETAFTNPTAGTSITRHYSYTVPSGSNPANMSVIGMVQKYGTTISDRAIENAVSSKTRFMPAGSSAVVADSFTAYTNSLCSGSEFFITTPTYHSGLTVYTEYGDGSSDTHTILSLGTNGYADFMHSYATSGSYTVKQKLFSGATLVDSLMFTNVYTLCNVIPVSFYLDGNGNCIKDSAESFVYQPMLTEIDSNGVAVDTISSTSGFYYTAYGNTGDIYTFRVIDVSAGFALACPSTGYTADTLQTGTYFEPINYFGLNCTTGSAFDLRIFPSARAGRHSFRANIAVDNTYCMATTGTVSMHLNPKYDFIFSTPTPASISGSLVTWTAGSLTSAAPGPTFISVYCEDPGPWYTMGDTVYTDYAIDPVAGDVNPSDNSCIRIDSVSSSYDPNFMDVSPMGIISAGAQLQYTIDFENTGNDTAFNIRVMDTLSDNVDISSLRLVMSSAKMMVSDLHDAAGHNIVKFDFPNINLLDSSHHGKCDGMVIFNIKTKPGLPNGTTIFNKAGIYFDNNPVVMTNIVEDIIGFPSKVNEVKQTNLQIYPNPANEELVIKMEPGNYNSFTITNSMGQIMMRQQLSSVQTKVNIRELPAGLYYVSVKGENGNKIQKFVKM